jgi:hypothetical protein
MVLGCKSGEVRSILDSSAVVVPGNASGARYGWRKAKSALECSAFAWILRGARLGSATDLSIAGRVRSLEID